MPFEVEGFFAAELDEQERQLRRQYVELDGTYRSICRVLFSALRAVEVNPLSARDLLVFALAANIATYCQASFLLAYRGMKVPGRACLRSALESLFSLVALVAAKRNFRRVRLKYLLESKKALTFSINRNRLVDVDGRDLSLRLRSVNQQIGRFKKENRRVTVAEMARLAHMTDVYEVRYNLYCSATHPDPISLVRTHGPQHQQNLVFQPENDLFLQLGEGLETLGKTSQALIHHFRLPDNELNALAPELIAAINSITLVP